jgi:PKD domain
MMKNWCFCLLVMGLSMQWAFAQNRDYVWLFGYESTNNPNTGWGGSVMDFNTDPPDIHYQHHDMEFNQTNASVCNEQGELQFYTNGKWVASHNHQPLWNGLGLNPGQFNDDSDDGYFMDQGAIIVPHPDGSNRYFLIHADRESTTLSLESHSPHLYYSLIDMDYDNGHGIIEEKNVVIIEDTLVIGKVTAVRHANGRDWWLVANEYKKNKFYRILVTPEGIQNLGTYQVGLPVPLAGIGQATFIPDGSKYIRNSLVGTIDDTDYLDVYDFDRCTGILSNHIQIKYVHEAGAGGVSVSPNSRFAYVSHQTVIWQYDLWSDNIASSKVLVAEYDGFTDGFIPTQFHLGQVAPDGKIYFDASSGVHYLHVIHQPNLPYPDCMVEQHGIHLPTYNAASLPNFPNYRLGPLDGSPCDTLGLNNYPVAKYRYDQDSINYQRVRFTDLSYYEPSAWAWDFGDGTSSTQLSPTHQYLSDGVYEVCLTVSNEYGEDTYCRTIQLGTSATNEEEQNPKQPIISVFPNPAQSATNFQLGGDYLPRQAMLTLYTATGQPVLSQRLMAGWSLVGLEGIAPGLYFWEVRDGDRQLGTGKLVRVE